MKLKSTLQLLVPTVAISSIPLLLGAVIAANVMARQQRAYKALDVDIAGIRAGEELAIGLRDLRGHLEHFVLTGKQADWDSAAETLTATEPWLSAAEHAAVTPREQDLVDRIKTGWKQFSIDFADLSKKPNMADSQARIGELIRTPLTQDMLVPSQEYLDFNEKEIETTNANNRTTASWLVAALVLLGICGPLSGLLAGFGISRGVSRSLVRLSVPVLDAAGKLNEVVGPVSLSAFRSLDDLEGALQHIAKQVGATVMRLQESQRRALRAEQLAAVGQLAAGMAHELRNPLTSMKVLLQAAADTGPPVELDSHDLSILEEEIARLETLTQGLLDFGRPPRPEMRPVVFQDLIRQVLELVERRAAMQDIRLERQLPETPAAILADGAQVRQVVLNLLLNGLEAIRGAGVVRVELSAEPGAPATGLPPRNPVAGAPGSGSSEPSVCLKILDTGCGLPPADGPNIFEPFVSTKETGIGLGLSISKRIVEDHGGTLTAKNRPEGGAVFLVRLPALRLGAADAAGTDFALVGANPPLPR
jgi:signal transduction histidine kinase